MKTFITLLFLGGNVFANTVIQPNIQPNTTLNLTQPLVFSNPDPYISTIEQTGKVVANTQSISEFCKISYTLNPNTTLILKAGTLAYAGEAPDNRGNRDFILKRHADGIDHIFKLTCFMADYRGNTSRIRVRPTKERIEGSLPMKVTIPNQTVIEI